MTVPFRFARIVLISALAAAGGQALAQAAQATLSPAKKELVARALTLQQPAIENVGNALAGQTANQVLQVTAQALAKVPADKREALSTELQGDVRKFYEDVAPTLREQAATLAPETIGKALGEKFSEDELKVLITWLESPVNRKFQAAAGEMLQALGQKLVAETRPVIEPRLKALEQSMSAKLNAATGTAAPKASAPGAAKPAAASTAKK